MAKRCMVCRRDPPAKEDGPGGTAAHLLCRRCWMLALAKLSSLAPGRCVYCGQPAGQHNITATENLHTKINAQVDLWICDKHMQLMMRQPGAMQIKGEA